jgi:hypothetical protein
MEVPGGKLLVSFLHDTSKEYVYISQWSNFKFKTFNTHALIIYYYVREYQTPYGSPPRISTIQGLVKTSFFFYDSQDQVGTCLG